jgi:PAS domain S-box-containing protein
MSSSTNVDPRIAASGAAGEMEALLRAKDWSATPLGATSTWSPTLRIIVDTIMSSQFPMAVRWGRDFVLIYNDGYRPILGEKHPWVLGLPFREAWPEVQAQLGALHEGLLSGARSAVFFDDLLLRIRRRGEAFEDAYFTVSYSPVRDETAPTGIGGVLITAVETTNRVALERALRDREAELARVQEIGQVGGVEVFLKGGFRNRRSREYLIIHGLPPEAVNETHADWVRRVHAEDRVETERQFIDAVHGDAREYRSEYRIIRPSDGEVRWIQVRAEIERDADGKPLRLVGAHIDITERKRAEEALRKLNETLEQQVAERTRERDRLWRVSDDFIGVANFEGHWVGINPAAAAILGWSEEELLAMPIASLWHPDDVEATFAYRGQLIQGGPTVRFQNRYRHKDGSYRWLSWSSTAEDGFIYALGRDVTAEREAADALRRTEEQLRQAQKMEAVGQLTGGIAHDFNNLLTGVIGSLDLMQRRIGQGRLGDVERYATSATTSARRAAALTHRLLAFARRQPLDPKPVAINQLVRSMEELLRRTTGEAIALEIVAAAGLWATFCDPHQLESALLNLVINSRDAMPDGGTLTIETANAHLDYHYADMRDVTPGQYVCLSVTDTGAGMAPAVIARAFDPFFTTKPIGQGTGLGLSMVYGFARQSEGHARIYSEAGQGTTVKLYLPRYRGKVDDIAAAAPGSDRHTAQAGETVVVIEDELAVRELVLDVLSDLGYHALEAVDGPSGLKILQSDARIDLLVTDVGLPGMNGRQVAEAARQARPDLKVLFITGYAENAAITNGFLAPGMEMMTKPFAVEALAARIRDMIGG